MLCLGSVYARSIFVPELIDNYTTAQTQLVFGVLITTYTLAIVVAGKWERKFGPHILTLLSAAFFSLGYITAGLSKDNFFCLSRNREGFSLKGHIKKLRNEYDNIYNKDQIIHDYNDGGAEILDNKIKLYLHASIHN